MISSILLKLDVVVGYIAVRVCWVLVIVIATSMVHRVA